jgi:hypothetical protein
VTSVVDIQTVSIAIASAGVLVAATYYALQIRHQTKSRRAESFWHVFSTFNTKEYYEAFVAVHSLDFVDYEDFASKYGDYLSGKCTVNVSIDLVCDLFEGAAFLFRKGLMDYDAIAMLPVIPTWEKVKLIAEAVRKKPGFAGTWTKFENAYNELKKREQRLQQSKA